jgi:hypothetical protein
MSALVSVVFLIVLWFGVGILVGIGLCKWRIGRATRQPVPRDNSQLEITKVHRIAPVERRIPVDRPRVKDPGGK